VVVVVVVVGVVVEVVVGVVVDVVVGLTVVVVVVVVVGVVGVVGWVIFPPTMLQVPLGTQTQLRTGAFVVSRPDLDV
jgi:hypothetical protein